MLNELDKLEQQADVLMHHLEVNNKKIYQQKLADHNWDIRRIEANQRIINELRYLAELINELQEYIEREQLVK